MLTRCRLLAALSILLLSQSAGCMLYVAEGEIEFQKTMDFAGVRKVCVETRNGSIEVQCEPGRREADIQATKFARGVTVEEACRYAEDIQIDAERDPTQPDTLRIVAHWPPGQAMRSRGARFRIALPTDTSLQLKTSNGRVTAARAAGDVDIDTSNGRISITESGGNVHADSSNGDIVLRDVAGDVNVKTSNGDIDLDRAGRASLRLVTSNGGIRAFNASGNAHARSSNGSVELHLVRVPDRPEITAVSSNGRVLVETPSPVNARLRMRTSNGRVHANLKESTPVRDLETGRSHFHATLNEGGGSIEIRSSNGSVTFQSGAGA